MLGLLSRAYTRAMSRLEDARTVIERFRLDGKVAIVTGASSGLGVAFADSLAGAGAKVSLGARRADQLLQAKKRIEADGGSAYCAETDVTDPDACRQLVEGTLEAFGQVDILVNNAGISDAVPALKESTEEFDRVVSVNLRGSFLMAQACARVMNSGSSIINISSCLALTQGDFPAAAYSSSKAGVLGLTRDLAGQWTVRKGIRVNALVPGYFATEMTQSLVEEPEYLQKVMSRTPMGRLGEPAELSGALIFLASDASSYMTGAEVAVDGGWTMR